MFDFKGTGVAIITPFDKNKLVDYKALKKLINYIIEGGVDYIVTLGTTGETPVLSKDEKIEIINFTKEVINGRIPLVVGIGGNNTAEVVNDLLTYPLDGVSAILSASPNYNKPSQEGIYQHYKEIALKSPKPIILYNVPGRTCRNMTASTIIRLANDFENIIGIKEASGDMLQCMEIIKDKPSKFFVVSGDDALALPQIACGLQGVISVAANAFPSEFSQLVKLCLNNDYEAARKINDRLIPAYQYLFEENNPAGVKAILFEMGLIENELRLPLVSLSEEVHQKIKKYLLK